MNEETKFEEGDRVEWCGRLGIVKEVSSYVGVTVLFSDVPSGYIATYDFEEDGRLMPWHTEPSLKLISKAKKKRKVKLYAYLQTVRNGYGHGPEYFQQLAYITCDVPGLRIPELDKEVEVEE